MSISCEEVSSRMEMLRHMRELLQSAIETATSKTVSPEQAREALERAKEIKVTLAAHILELERDSSFKITVPDAPHPYRKVLSEVGDGNPSWVESIEEITFDLYETIKIQSERYIEQGLPEWADDIYDNQDLLEDFISDSAEIKKIEARIKAGMIPIIMPGKETQMKTWRKALENLRPEWISFDFMSKKSAHASFIHNKVSEKMIDSANGFFHSTPERSYLVWTKPAQTVDPVTKNKTFDFQMEMLQKFHAENPELYDADDITPLEYAALQSIRTHALSKWSKIAPSFSQMIVNPLDFYDSACRFISAGKFNRGALAACFLEDHPSNPEMRDRLVYTWDDVLADTTSGFRPVGRS